MTSKPEQDGDVLHKPANNPPTYKLWRPDVIAQSSPPDANDNITSTQDTRAEDIQVASVEAHEDVHQSTSDGKEEGSSAKVESMMRANFHNDDQFIARMNELNETLASVEEAESVSPAEYIQARQIQLGMESSDILTEGTSSPSISELSGASPPPYPLESCVQLPNVINSLNTQLQTRLYPEASPEWNTNPTYHEMESRQQLQQRQHVTMLQQQMSYPYASHPNIMQPYPQYLHPGFQLPQQHFPGQDYQQFNGYVQDQYYQQFSPTPNAYVHQNPMTIRNYNAAAEAAAEAQRQSVIQRNMRRPAPIPNIPIPNVMVKMPKSSPAPQAESSHKKRSRTAYTSYQLMELEREFAEGRYVCRSKRNAVAKELMLSERQVKIWFQNRRMKEKKEQQKNNLLPESEGHSTSGVSSGSASSSPSSRSSVSSTSGTPKAISAKNDTQSIVSRLLSHSPQARRRVSMTSFGSPSSSSSMSPSSTNIEQQVPTSEGFYNECKFEAAEGNENISSFYSSFQAEQDAKEAKMVKLEVDDLNDINNINPTIGCWFAV